MSTATPTAPEASAKRSAPAWLKNQYALYILVGLVIIASFSSSAFLTTGNMTNLILQMAVIGIVVLAELIIVITGGIDISVGSVLGLAAVLSAGVNGGSSVVVGLLVALGVGCAMGALNGGLVAFRGIDPFIVTLGMLALARGLVYAYTEGSPLSPSDSNFNLVGTTTFAGIPVLGLIWGAVIALVAFILYRTVFGRRLYAIGSNSSAAYSSGVPVKKTLFLTYIVAGLLVGLAGFLLTARIGAGTPDAGTNYELDAIAAVVIGGARLSGGYGKVFGAVLGTAIFGIISNVLVLLNVSTFLQSAVKGGLILLAVLLASAGRGNRAHR